MQFNFFQLLRRIEDKLTSLDKKVEGLSQKMDFSIQLQRNHLIRVKNNFDISDEMILTARPYNDLSPDLAYKIYNQNDADFQLIDVSSADFNPPNTIKGAIHIPMEELPQRIHEVTSKTLPVMIISETGINSISACEFLVTKGHFNTNNISGGHRFWPGHHEKDLDDSV